MNWLLNFIGILIFFINRFFGKTDKATTFNWKYWLKDNWQEGSTTLLLNIAFMLMIHFAMDEASVTALLAKLPDWLTFLGIPGICFILGAGASWGVYELFKAKVSTIGKG